MPIDKGEIFASRDVFIDYPYEQAMFRWDVKTQTIYLRFYGEVEHPDPVAHDDGLFNEALLYGDEISEAAYYRGKQRRER